jgi:hypothetical protein
VKYILIILSLSFITSCSSIQLTFFFADRFIASRVGQSFYLDSRQEGLLRKQINTDLNSNKPKIGKHLDQFLFEIETMARADSISFEEFSKFDTQLIDFRLVLVSILKPSVEQFVSTAKNKNFENFGKDKRREQTTDKKKVQGLETFVKFFLGSITKQQTKIFEAFVSSNSEFYALQFETRKDFSSKILEKPTPIEKTNFIFLYLNGDASVRSQEYVEQHGLFKQRAMKMWFEFWNSVTPNQRKVLIKNLEKYRGQIQETFL